MCTQSSISTLGAPKYCAKSVSLDVLSWGVAPTELLPQLWKAHVLQLIVDTVPNCVPVPC